MKQRTSSKEKNEFKWAGYWTSISFTERVADNLHLWGCRVGCFGLVALFTNFFNPNSADYYMEHINKVSSHPAFIEQ